MAAGKLHTVCFSHSHVYTFGRNEGQLGHPKGEPFQVGTSSVCLRVSVL